MATKGGDERSAAVSTHYQGDADASVLDRFLAALEAVGENIDPIAPTALATVEEFHLGGRAATDALADRLGLTAESRVLDIGCGVGGAARHLVRRYGCAAAGIDLTPGFIEAARELSRRCGLAERLSFTIGDATALPFEAQAFDAAITLHAAMNIADRDGLYREAHRVLRPGAPFCVYDVMRVGPGEIAYPVPWASDPEHSHLLSPEETEAALIRAGFAVEAVENRRESIEASLTAPLPSSGEGAPSLGPHLVMGPAAPIKVAHMRAAVSAGVVAPVAIFARKPAS